MLEAVILFPGYTDKYFGGRADAGNLTEYVVERAKDALAATN